MQLPSNKKFGLFFSLVFFIFFIYSIFENLDSIYIFLFSFVSFFFLVSAFLIPKILYPLNISWMFLGYLLGKITGPIVLSVMYFFLITPFGVFRKFLGSDELRLKKNKLNSYWINVDKNDKEIQSFKNQF